MKPEEAERGLSQLRSFSDHIEHGFLAEKMKGHVPRLAKRSPSRMIRVEEESKMDTIETEWSGEKERREEILRLHDEIHSSWGMCLQKAIRIGQLLKETKALLAHGSWINWIEANMPFSIRAAERYMSLTKVKIDNLADLNLSIFDAERLLPHKLRGMAKIPKGSLIHLTESGGLWTEPKPPVVEPEVEPEALVEAPPVEISKPEPEAGAIVPGVVEPEVVWPIQKSVREQFHKFRAACRHTESLGREILHLIQTEPPNETATRADVCLDIGSLVEVLSGIMKHYKIWK